MFPHSVVDPYVFGPPGSGCGIILYGSGLGHCTAWYPLSRKWCIRLSKCDSKGYWPHLFVNSCFLTVLWIRMFWGPTWIRIRHYFVRIRILPSTSKKVRKTLISTILWLLVDFLSMKTEVYLQKVIRKKTSKTKLIFRWHLVSHWWKKSKKQDLDP